MSELFSRMATFATANKAEIERKFRDAFPDIPSVELDFSEMPYMVEIRLGTAEASDYDDPFGGSSYKRDVAYICLENCEGWTRQGILLSFRLNNMAVREREPYWNRCINNDEYNAEGIFDEILQFLQDKYRKPVPNNGCVQAFVNKSKKLWLVKRANSNMVVKVGDDFYLKNPAICAIEEEDGTLRWVHFEGVREWQSNNVGNYVEGVLPLDDANGRRLANLRVFAPLSRSVEVYQSYSRLTDRTGPLVGRYPLMTFEASDNFRERTRRDGSTIWVQMNNHRGVSYESRDIHGYSVRIEHLLDEEEDLFKLGTVDLYRNRPLAEVPFLGWELEACSNLSTSNAPAKMKELLNKVVMCKSDSSIFPSGFETVSIPATLDYWRESKLKEAMDVMRKAPFNMRSYEHGSCGFHVHVSRTALSTLDLQKLERFMHNPHNREFLEKIAGRGPNTYSNYYPNHFYEKRNLGVSTRTSGSVVLIVTSVPSDSQYACIYPDFETNPNPVLKFIRMVWSVFSTSSLAEAGGYRISQDVFSHYRVSPHLWGYGAQDSIEQNIFLCLPDWLNRTDNTGRDLLLEIVRRCWPDKDLSEYTSSNFSNEDSKWKVGLRKTDKPIGRQNNYEACRLMKSNLGKQAAGRYDVLNTGGRNTVEFRLFKGTMNPDSIFRYLEFVDAMVRFLPNTSALAGGVSYEAFLRWLMGDSFNVLRYEHLVAFLVSNGYIERKKVRRKELITPVEADASGLPTEITDDEDEYDECECEDCRPDLYDEDGCRL